MKIEWRIRVRFLDELAAELARELQEKPAPEPKRVPVASRKSIRRS